VAKGLLPYAFEKSDAKGGAVKKEKRDSLTLAAARNGRSRVWGLNSGDGTLKPQGRCGRSVPALVE